MWAAAGHKDRRDAAFPENDREAGKPAFDLLHLSSLQLQNEHRAAHSETGRCRYPQGTCQRRGGFWRQADRAVFDQSSVRLGKSLQ